MAARIVQIDLAQPLPELRTDRADDGDASAAAAVRYDRLWLLVKLGRQPLGWVECAAKRFGRAIAPELLAGLIADAIPSHALDDARERAAQPADASPPHEPSFSVVVCARRDGPALSRLLGSLAALRYPNYEIIVVDTAPHADAARLACAAFPNVKCVAEPRRGLNYARNTGWQVARKEIVAYADDDATIDPDWLAALAENFRDPRVNAVAGVTFARELETAAQERLERDAIARRGVLHRRVYSPGPAASAWSLLAGPCGVGGMNLAVRRQTLESIGGFDPALGVGSVARGGADLDVMARVLRDGGTVIHEPRAICFRSPVRTMRQLRGRAFDDGWAFSALCGKYAHDLELGNLAVPMLARRFAARGWRRLKANLKLALARHDYFPVHLIVLEVAGGLFGLRAYRTSQRRVRSEAVKFKQKGVIRPAALAPLEMLRAIAAAKAAAAAQPADQGQQASPASGAMRAA